MITPFYEFENINYNPSQGGLNSVRVFSYKGFLSFIPNSDLKHSSKGFMRTLTGTLTADRQYAFPDKSGTIALEGGTIAPNNVMDLISLRI